MIHSLPRPKSVFPKLLHPKCSGVQPPIRSNQHSYTIQGLMGTGLYLLVLMGAGIQSIWRTWGWEKLTQRFHLYMDMDIDIDPYCHAAMWKVKPSNIQQIYHLFQRGSESINSNGNGREERRCRADACIPVSQWVPLHGYYRDKIWSVKAAA